MLYEPIIICRLQNHKWSLLLFSSTGSKCTHTLNCHGIGVLMLSRFGLIDMLIYFNQVYIRKEQVN